MSLTATYAGGDRDTADKPVFSWLEKELFERGSYDAENRAVDLFNRAYDWIKARGTTEGQSQHGALVVG